MTAGRVEICKRLNGKTLHQKMIANPVLQSDAPARSQCGGLISFNDLTASSYPITQNTKLEIDLIDEISGNPAAVLGQYDPSSLFSLTVYEGQWFQIDALVWDSNAAWAGNWNNGELPNAFIGMAGASATDAWVTITFNEPVSYVGFKFAAGSGNTGPESSGSNTDIIQSLWSV